ncbi:hypothetical protein MLD38_016115 [Melastoma candidum]|uniref:Uncharacterized protein n=1 Tax=Melastoma candidum TaxID=119954 RepID=A0ACB9RJJ0_9MYRT|nr:hypothetical protein MLD38_016115 [Melastoma candidum]
MESLPVEVIGNILSRFKAARDVVIASRRKWREACRYHLRALSFDFSNWVRTRKNINILERCGRQRLEVLSLAHTVITRSSQVTRSSLASDTQVTMESISTSLKDHVEVLSLDKLVVEADNLQKLRLRNRFMVWVAGLLERCPNLKKLVIYVSASRANLEEEYEMIANMHTAVIPLMRKHNQIFLTLFYL